MNKKTVRKKPWEMTSAELEELALECERDIAAGNFRPLTPAQRAKWERLRRKSIQKAAAHTQTTVFHVENALLKKLDRLAKKSGGALRRGPELTGAA